MTKGQNYNDFFKSSVDLQFGCEICHDILLETSKTASVENLK